MDNFINDKKILQTKIHNLNIIIEDIKSKLTLMQDIETMLDGSSKIIKSKYQSYLIDFIKKQYNINIKVSHIDIICKYKYNIDTGEKTDVTFENNTNISFTIDDLQFLYDKTKYPCVGNKQVRRSVYRLSYIEFY